MDKTRINKYIAALTKYSRRQIDDFICQGKVKVNNKALNKNDLGHKVDGSEEILLNNEKIESNPKKFVYLALHKPKNIITTNKRQAKQKIVLDLIPENLNVNPVGRLDKNSTGLIILTNDGDLAQQLTHPKYEHEKEYIVELKEPVTEKQYQTLNKGIKLEEGLARARKISKINKSALNIILTTGFNRQIRKMVEAVDNKVVNLQRVRINKLKLGSLPVGKWRYIKKQDIINE